MVRVHCGALIVNQNQSKHSMPKRAVEPKASAPPAEERFVELMMMAADFVKNSGGMDQAKKALSDAGQFIKQAGSVANAERALAVLDNLRDKIGR
jgi:hypothetical protein